MAKPDDVKHQIYIDERKSLVEAEQTIAHNLIKIFLFSLRVHWDFLWPFWKILSPNQIPETLVFLYISWFSLVLSLLATLSSLLIGQYAFRRARDILEDEFFPPKNPSSNRNLSGTITQILNWSSIVFFIIGVSTLVFFTVQNMKLNFIDKKSETTIVRTNGSANEK